MLSGSLSATVTIPSDLPDVVSSSTLIIRGRVDDTRAFTDIANGPVTTAVTVSVSETLKGTADRAITFRVHGGELGRYRQVMIGEPVFAVGDDVYLFLKRAPDGALWTVGMGAGVYKVSMAAGMPAVMPPPIAGVTATAGAQVIRGDARRKPMRTRDFASLVTLLVANRAVVSPRPPLGTAVGRGGGSGRGGARR
jgi:hypothetical protein